MSDAAPSASTVGRTSSGPHSAIALMSAPAAKMRAAPQDEGSDLVAVGSLTDRVVELGRELEIDRVRRWPVEPDDTDTVVDLEPHGVAHRGGDAAGPRRRPSPPSEGRPAWRRRTASGEAEPLGCIGCVRARRRARASTTWRLTGRSSMDERRERAVSPSRCSGRAAGPASSASTSSAATMSGPSRPQIPARSSSRSSAIARVAARSPTATGATRRRPDRDDRWHSARRPPWPRTRGSRRHDRGAPDHGMALAGRWRPRPLRETLARRNGTADAGEAPGTETNTIRRTPASRAAATARMVDSVVRGEQGVVVDLVGSADQMHEREHPRSTSARSSASSSRPIVTFAPSARSGSAASGSRIAARTRPFGRAAARGRARPGRRPR